MAKARFYFYMYEVLSLSLGLSVLFLFGVLSFFPKEIMLMADGQTWFWAFIFISLSTFFAFLILSFYKHQFSLYIMRISDLLIVFLSILCSIYFLIFTQDLMDPWIMQTAWFLRYYGFLVGFLLGLVCFKTITGFSFLIAKSNEEEAEKFKEKTVFGIVFSSFCFFMVEVQLLREYTLLSVFLYLFILHVVLLSASLVLISNVVYKDKLRLSSSPQIPDFGGSERDSRFQKFNKKLIKAKTDRSSFWWLFFPLLATAILSVVIAILYPFELYMDISFPWQNSTVFVSLPLIQILSYLLLIALFFILIFAVIGGRAKNKYHSLLKEGKHSRLKTSLLGLVDSLRFLGLWFAISLLLYFYDYPLFFPRIISSYLFFGLFGAALYFIAGRKQRNRHLLYAFAIILLVINLGLIYQDGMYNYENYYDGGFEITFPFQFLHSPLNLITVGLAIGILISDILLNYGFKYTKGGDSPNRGALLSISCFLGGLLMMIALYLMNNPGGDPPLTDQTNEMFYLFCLGLSLILLVGLMFNYALTELIFPYYQKLKGRDFKERKVPSSKKSKKVLAHTEEEETWRKKLVVGSLITLMVISIFGGLAIYMTFQETYQKPVIAYSPGNYYIWVQNSSERVSRDMEISLASSPRIEEIEFSMAKNEYHAVQLVWRPLGGSIKSLSYEISNFVHEEDENEIIFSNCCSLRHEEYIIEGEFPDVLIPFTQMDLTEHQNYVFWFSLKTPYEIEAGTYEGEIKFEFNEKETEKIKIKIEVWDFAIPKMRHLRSNIGWTRGTSQQIENYFYHRMNDYGVPIRYTDDIEKLNTEEEYSCYYNTSNEQWVFNWTWWDNLTEYKLNNSMNAFAVQYPLGIADGGRVPYIEDDERMGKMKKWLKRVESHLIDKHWLNYSFYYFIDEFQIFIPEEYDSREDYFEDVEELLKEMKDAAPKIKIMTTTPPSEELKDLRKYIDIYCPVSSDRDKDRWDERLEADCEFWMYACVGPMAPWPNSHLYNRLYECRILLWQCWLYDLHGFLYWASQAYYHGQYGIGYNGYGDGWFLYERKGQLYDSLRWENYLDAQEDFEVLWLMDAAIQYLEENEGIVSRDKVKSLKETMNDILQSVVGERWKYCDHPLTVYMARDQIGEILDDLSGDVNLTAIGESKWTPPYTRIQN
ncbi:MAG: DUF4091 domain-containing protein [Promethearchaeota archaeon]|nr:MAG: DUF4091 domain-containing protein [Candidatus Lokiarchaeota archaeon]